MYLTVHSASGLLIGSYIINPYLSFLVSFVAHFLLDMIPHDPLELDKWVQKGNEKVRFFAIGMTDIWFLTVMLLLLNIEGLLLIRASIIAGIIGSLLPDFIWTGAEILNIKNKVAVWYKKIHMKTHQIFRYKHLVPYYTSVIVQLSLLIIFLILYLSHQIYY